MSILKKDPDNEYQPTLREELIEIFGYAAITLLIFGCFLKVMFF